MSTEFERLYKEYWQRICFLSVIPLDLPEWKALSDWSKEHKEEAIDAIIEILKEGPDNIVGLCDVLFPKTVTYEGYCTLECICNIWLTILLAYKNGETIDTKDTSKFPDHYRAYKAYEEYLKREYIPWNPFKEADPNITFTDFKKGRRNDKVLVKQRNKENNNV